MPVTVPSKIVVVGTSSISLKDRFSVLPKPKPVSSKVSIILYLVCMQLLGSFSSIQITVRPSRISMLGQRRATASCFSLVIALKWNNVSLRMPPVYKDDLVKYVSFSSTVFYSIRENSNSNGFIPVRRRSLRAGGGRFAAGVYIPAASSICAFFKHFVQFSSRVWLCTIH